MGNRNAYSFEETYDYDNDNDCESAEEEAVRLFGPAQSISAPVMKGGE